jgi:hypothetical protein
MLPRAIAVEVFVHADLQAVGAGLPSALGIPEARDGGVLLRGSADDLEWYARELMRLPFRFDARAPVELRRTLGKLATEIAKQYAD